MVGDFLVVEMPYTRDKGRIAVLLGPIDRLFLRLEGAEHTVGVTLTHKISNGASLGQKILSDIQYHSLPTGNLDRVSPATGQDGAGEGRDVRHRSARWIGLVLSTMRNVCSRPSSLRTVTVMPKDTVRVSEDGLTTSAFARRARQ